MSEVPRSRPLIIAIDGPSGVGKSTVARRVSEMLRLPYLSTGVMYRALALKIRDLGIDPEDRSAVEEAAAAADIQLVSDSRVLRVLLDGRDPGDRAYSLEVSQLTSKISAYPGVRLRMVALQRLGAQQQGAVLEGRDIGTRVFPEARHKFFLDASAEVRAERRWLQLTDQSDDLVDREEVLREVRSRDARDSTREESPLTKDASYTVVATDNLSAEEVATLIVEQVQSSESAGRGAG